MEDDNNFDAGVDVGVPTAPLGVWIGLTLVAAVSFWCQATVTEERFVPALNVIATRFKIPDDIAGATLMAAGASSPELFSSIVALFVTHSSLGLGTIVGSEIFNQLIICAGAVFASCSGKLELDRAIVTREVGFYALSIVLLWLSLQDSRPVPDDTENHLFISFGDSVMIFSGYVLYVLVCANMEKVVSFCSAFASDPWSYIFFCCCKRPEQQGRRGKYERLVIGGSGGAGQSTNYGTSFRRANLPVGAHMPFLTQTKLTNEPSGNFVRLYHTTTGEKAIHRKDLHGSAGGGEGGDQQQQQQQQLDMSGLSSRGVTGGGEYYDNDLFSRGGGGSRASAQISIVEQSIKNIIGRFSDGNTLRGFDFLLDAEKPSDEHNLYDIEFNSFEERLSCFMWQKSYFYTKARFATRGWHLRWFTLAHLRMYSVPDRAQFERHRVKYPAFKTAEVDEERLIVHLINPEAGKRDFYLMAPSRDIFNAFLEKLELMIEAQEKKDEEGEGGVDSTRASITTTESGGDENFESGDDHISLIAFPYGESSIDIIFFVLLLPLRYLMHYTLPDVRKLDQTGNPVGTVNKAFLSVVSCLLWLIVGSYAMVASLESLAALMNIPDSVVGFTVSAAGTSLPNYVASKVAAQNGFGNMAVSNAFGSNTFNIMIGLGLPWLLYTSFGTGFKPYHGLRDEAITESVIILAIVLLAFVVLVIPANFTIYKWHGYLFIVMYVAYLVFAIGQVYW